MFTQLGILFQHIPNPIMTVQKSESQNMHLNISTVFLFFIGAQQILVLGKTAKMP